MKYLERYQNGGYDQVWHDLRNLGEATHQDDLHQDVMAVAKETMRRVRENILVLTDRLHQIGYTLDMITA